VAWQRLDREQEESRKRKRELEQHLALLDFNRQELAKQEFRRQELLAQQAARHQQPATEYRRMDYSHKRRYNFACVAYP
jgi:hypothetical protein